LTGHALQHRTRARGGALPLTEPGNHGPNAYAERPDKTYRPIVPCARLLRYVVVAHPHTDGGKDWKTSYRL
jgi:hypothetical protein